MRLTDPERIRAMTRPWPGKRYANGRPQVANAVLARLQTVAVNDACDVLADYGFEHNYAGDWTVLCPNQVLVGRAVTCRWVPIRPDLHDAIIARGAKDGRIGFPNSWVIDELIDGDVLVADLFGAINLVGDNLTTAIKANGGRGMVIDGGLRDLRRIKMIPDFCTYVKRIHPEAIPGVTMPEINDVTRIGPATCLPGDVVLGDGSGVVFIPPHLAAKVADCAGDYRKAKSNAMKKEHLHP